MADSSNEIGGLYRCPRGHERTVNPIAAVRVVHTKSHGPIVVCIECEEDSLKKYAMTKVTG